jgi:hypothetical protein
MNNKFINLFIGNENNIKRKNMIWNAVGSAVFAIASMLLTIMTSRILGEIIGAMFIFGLSTVGQQMLNVSYLGIRPYHVTDAENKYSFGDYLLTRFVGCGLAIVCGILYVWINNLDILYMWIVLLAVIYKTIDGAADVYECEFQRTGYLHLTGKSIAFRTFMSAAVYIITLMTTKNIIISCIAINISAILGLIIFNVNIIKNFKNIDFKFDIQKCKNLFNKCFALFLGGFLDLYIFSASRYAAESGLNKVNYEAYGILFMPISVINLVTTFIVRPYLTSLSNMWSEHNYKEYKKMILKLCIVIAGLGALAVILSFTVAVDILGLVYNRELSNYKGVLVTIIIGGVLNSITTVLYYVLIIMKGNKEVFIAYIVGTVIAVIICPILVSRNGIVGAGIAHMVLMCAMTFIFGIFSVIVYRKSKTNTIYVK